MAGWKGPVRDPHFCPICKQVYKCPTPKICRRPDCCICLTCMISPNVHIQGLVIGYMAEFYEKEKEQ